jgi:hypothetical protein
MAGEADRNARGGAFGREDAAVIRGAWSRGEPPRCPTCDVVLDPAPVPPRGDVAYVRSRVLLLCRTCRRSVSVERRDRRPGAGSPATEGRGVPPGLPRVGWREWVTLGPGPVGPVRAKVDTGARTSALHAENLEPFDRDGSRWIRFTLLPFQRSREGAVVLEAPLVDRRRVRSSSGVQEERPVVRLPLHLGTHVVEAEVTLTRRDLMGFRMLIGRTALRGRFLVDPSASFLQGTPEPPPSPGVSTP